MSTEHLLALIAKIKEDAGFREKLQGAADLDAAVAITQEAGFDVSKADLLKYQAKQTLDLSEGELERVAGGFSISCNWNPVESCQTTCTFCGPCR